MKQQGCPAVPSPLLSKKSPDEEMSETTCLAAHLNRVLMESRPAVEGFLLTRQRKSGSDESSFQDGVRTGSWSCQRRRWESNPHENRSAVGCRPRRLRRRLLKCFLQDAHPNLDLIADITKCPAGVEPASPAWKAGAFAARPRARCISQFLPVGAAGFEPTISWFRTRRIAKLSHTPLSFESSSPHFGELTKMPDVAGTPGPWLFLIG